MIAAVAGGILLAGLTLYAALGGADFGGGLWDLLAGGYQRVWSAISSVLGELPPADRDAVLGGTARVFYQLGEERPCL